MIWKKIKEFCVNEIENYKQSNYQLIVNINNSRILPNTTPDSPTKLMPLSSPSSPNVSSIILPSPNLQMSDSNSSSENPTN